MATLLNSEVPSNSRKPRREIAPRALIALLVFHGVLQVLVIGTGLVQIPLSGVFAWFFGLIALAAASVAFHFAPEAQCGPASWPARAFALLGALILGVYFVLAWIKIDPSFDGNWYHIPVIHFWAAKGYIHWVAADPPAAWCTMALDYMNGYPNAHEVTSFWLARLLGDSAINAASVLYLPLGAFGVYIVSNRLGAEANWSAFGALLYLLLPVNIAQVHTTYVDSSFAACVVGLLALMVLLHEMFARNPSGPGESRRSISCHTISPKVRQVGLECAETRSFQLIESDSALSLCPPGQNDPSEKGPLHCSLNDSEQDPSSLSNSLDDEILWHDYRISPTLSAAIGIALGLIAGIKGNGPLVALLAGLFIAGNLLLALRSLKSRELRHNRVTLSGLSLIILAALLTGGYWNIRNWVIGGSPVYPIGITLGGVEIFPGEPFEKIVNTRGQTPPEMRDWPAWKQVGHTWLQGQSMKRWHGALGEYASRFGGLSFLWLLGALPASIALATSAVVQVVRKRSRGDREGLYIYLFAFIALLFLITPNNWWARYTVWIFGIGLPAFIYCASRPMKRPSLSILKWCWTLACCAVFFYEAGVASITVADAKPPFWKPTEGTTYWKPAETSPYARMLAEPEAPVALYKLITRRQSILGTLCQPIGRRPVYFLSEETAADPEAMARFVKEHNIQYLITGEKGAQPKGIQKLAPEKQHAKTWNINIYAVK